VTTENVKQKKFTLRAQVNYAGAVPAAPKLGAPTGKEKTAMAEPDAPTQTASRGRVTP
jgi:hypothetical protein